MEFNVVTTPSGERGYYINGSRFERVFWRKCMELEIDILRSAIVHAELMLKQDQTALSAVDNVLNGIAGYELDAQGREYYKDIRRQLVDDMREIRLSIARGNDAIEMWSDRLED